MENKMTLNDWRLLNREHITVDDEIQTVLEFNKPSMRDIQNAVDTENWSCEVFEHFMPTVVNDTDTFFSWLYLVDDSGIDMVVKINRAEANRVIGYSDAYSDEWETVERIAFTYNRQTGLSTCAVQLPSMGKPIELSMY